MTCFADRLADAVRSKGSSLVVGLDPVLERLPRALVDAARDDESDPRRAAAQAIAHFNEVVIEQVAPYACAVKPQIAFFEAWGPPGFEAYELAVRQARDAGLIVIGDIKRGDIGSTSQAYVRAHLLAPDEHPRADAVTIHPYLGSDSIAPFLDAVRDGEKGLFVLVRTSNPSATEIQDLAAGGRPVHEHVAALVNAWGEPSLGRCGYSGVGAVVGATAPKELARLRGLMPRTWLLIPGVGAQGATAADVAPAFDGQGLGAIVNSSRGILYAYGAPTAPGWPSAVGDAARTLRDALNAAARPRVTPRPNA